VETAYQTVNNTVERIIDEVGTDSEGKPNSNIIVVSDHGFVPRSIQLLISTTFCKTEA